MTARNNKIRGNISSNKILNFFLGSGGPLSVKTIRGGFWMFSFRMGDQIFKFVRTIVLARLISPHDFGLFGIALLTLATLDTFSDTGFKQALIQKKGDVRDYLDTAWTVQVIRGLLIALLLFFSAPYVASFFGTEAAEPMLRVIGIATLFQNLVNISVVYFEKELKFNKFFIYQFSGTVVDVTIAIVFGILTRSVWAMVWGLLAGHFVRMIASYLIDSYRPRIKWRWTQFKELFVFGKWVLGSSILIFLLIQGADIFIGKLLGAAALGFYQMAYRISNLPAIQISNVVATVLFPAYSKLQDKKSKLRAAYLKALQVVTSLTIPISGLIFVLASDFTKIFLGVQWLPIVPVVQVLAIYGSFRALGATTGALFLAVGKPEIRTKIQISQLVLLTVLIYPLTVRFGILGTSIAMVTYAFMFNILAVYLVLKLIKSDFKKPFRIVMIPFFSSVVSISVIMALKVWLVTEVSLIRFILLSIVGVFIYLLLIYFSDKLFGYGIRRLIRDQIRVLNRAS